MSSAAAPSTIAATLHNVLAIEGSSLTGEQLLQRAANHHPGLEQAEVDEALVELVDRTYVTATGSGAAAVYRVGDPSRRPVVSRDLSGDGWGGWMVFDLRLGARVAIGS